jgi:hypothetical protein
VREIACFVLFVFAVYGLANAVAVLKFGLPIRKVCKPIPVLGLLICCPACLAFWFALGGSWGAFSPARLFVDNWWKAMVVDGLAASGGVWLLHLAAERMGHGLDL